MSEKDAQAFFDHVDRDPELQARLKAVSANYIAIARDCGYDLTQQELREHLQERWGVTKPPEYDDPDTTCAA